MPTIQKGIIEIITAAIPLGTNCCAHAKAVTAANHERAEKGVAGPRRPARQLDGAHFTNAASRTPAATWRVPAINKGG